MIICGDCYSEMTNLDDNLIDLICKDPPYGIHYAPWDKQVPSWNILLSEFKRILKPSGSIIIFQGWSNVSELVKVSSEHFILKNWIIWDRIKGRGAKNNLISTREDILWLTNGDVFTYNKIYSNIPKKTSGMGKKKRPKE